MLLFLIMGSVIETTRVHYGTAKELRDASAPPVLNYPRGGGGGWGRGRTQTFVMRTLVREEAQEDAWPLLPR